MSYFFQLMAFLLCITFIDCFSRFPSSIINTRLSASTPRDMIEARKKNSLFAPDILQELQFVIEVISSRMNDKNPLKRDKLDRLESAVQVVIHDAHSYWATSTSTSNE